MPKATFEEIMSTSSLHHHFRACELLSINCPFKTVENNARKVIVAIMGEINNTLFIAFAIFSVLCAGGI